jgi:ketosteroid isomerase-like protein
MRSTALRWPARASASLRLLLCGLAALILGACAAAPPKPAATAGVEAAFEHYCELLRAMDHTGIAAMFAPDGEVDNPGAAPIRGPAAIDAFLQGFSDYHVLAYTTEAVRILVHGDTAELTGIFHQRVRVPQGEVIEVSGRLEAHWVRAGKGGWLVQRMATSPL